MLDEQDTEPPPTLWQNVWWFTKFWTLLLLGIAAFMALIWVVTL